MQHAPHSSQSTAFGSTSCSSSYAPALLSNTAYVLAFLMLCCQRCNQVLVAHEQDLFVHVIEVYGQRRAALHTQALEQRPIINQIGVHEHQQQLDQAR
jgi:hypothetical protein